MEAETSRGKEKDTNMVVMVSLRGSKHRGPNGYEIPHQEKPPVTLFFLRSLPSSL